MIHYLYYTITDTKQLYDINAKDQIVSIHQYKSLNNYYLLEIHYTEYTYL